MAIDRDFFRAEAHRCLGLWGCRADGEIHFTHSSLLWPVVRRGQAFMLKIVDPNDDEANSAEVLRYFSGARIVGIAEQEKNIQLLERLVAGAGIQPLAEMALAGKDDQATETISEVIRSLHSISLANPAPKNLIPFRSRSDAMREHMRTRKVKTSQLPSFQFALDLCEDLIRDTQSAQIALHGDIHHFNILHSEKRGWVAIDPKGIFGPRIYEFANLLCNPYRHQEIVADPRRMERQASLLSGHAGLDKSLLLNFVFLHAMQCAAWSLVEADQGYWLACARTAANLANLKIEFP